MRAVLAAALARFAGTALRQAKRRAKLAAVLLGSALVFVAVAVMGLALLLWLWLAREIGPEWAAVAIAAGAAIIAAILVFAARRALKVTTIDLGQERAKFVSTVSGEARKVPKSIPLAAAGLAGLVMGLRAGRRKKD